MSVLGPQRCVSGQYRNYTDFAGVEKDSQTKMTYVALLTEIDTWRWVGVLIFLCTGKALLQKITEVRFFSVPCSWVGFPAQPLISWTQPDRGEHRSRSGYVHAAIYPTWRLVA